MPQAKGRDMVLKIVACRQVYSGHNQRGDSYTIYEVDAAKRDGTLVNEKLRSFTALPIGQEVEVTVTPFESEQWGRSYTLHPKGQARSQGAAASVNELREEVEALREMVQKQADRINGLEQLMRQPRNGSSPQSPPPSAEMDEKFGADAPW